MIKIVWWITLLGNTVGLLLPWMEGRRVGKKDPGHEVVDGQTGRNNL